MSRAVRKQLFETLESLQKGNKYIEKLLDNGKQDDIIGLLTDCQDCAIVIGNRIEAVYGEGKECVHDLENYCESIFRLSKNLSIPDLCKKIYVQTYNQLQDVKSNMEREIPDMQEVVFLPYKASMWDSLESIWFEARDDEECDEYVIPIPYYDKNPDGSLREEHYEVDEYPEYVTVTRYDEYDFELRRPDMIFIHNPYDDCNYVTSVYPFFYSKNLKQYTNRLVYIPYFTLGEEMYAGFCVSPGTIASDVVVAQSLRAKKDYMFHLKQWYEANVNMNTREVESMLSKKILPLGSPKIDKVVNFDRTFYVLPEAWAKMLNGKKAVLYNTGVTGILNGKEQELRKIKDTLAFFSKRKDLVLWWRPHPLSIGTMQSMRPQLYEEYLAIIEEYRTSGVGIFDDTADLHRALLWTDMYYGDDSSLIYLYGVQGKPILLQDIFYLTEDHMSREDSSISYRVSCYVSDSIFFVAGNYNRLYRLDLMSKSINEIGEIPGEYQMEISLYSNIIHREGILWLVPSRAHALTGYSLSTGQWVQYELPDRIKFSTEINGKIYMISSDYSRLWTMDTEERKLNQEKLVYPQNEILPKSEEYYNNDLYLLNNKLYYLITHSNMIVMYDLQTKEACLIHIGLSDNKYQRILYDNNCFWCIPDDEQSSMVCWNGENVRELTKNSYPIGFSFQWGFSEAVCQDEGVFLFPQRGNMVLRLDKKSMEVEVVLLFDRCLDIQNVQTLSNNRLAFVSSVSQMDCRITILDSKGTVLDNYSIVCLNDSPIDFEEMFERLDKEKYNSRWAYQIKEVREYNISNVCDVLMKKGECINREQRNYFRNIYANGNGESGRHIWERLGKF